MAPTILAKKLNKVIEVVNVPTTHRNLGADGGYGKSNVPHGSDILA